MAAMISFHAANCCEWKWNVCCANSLYASIPIPTSSGSAVAYIRLLL